MHWNSKEGLCTRLLQKYYRLQINKYFHPLFCFIHQSASLLGTPVWKPAAPNKVAGVRTTGGAAGERLDDTIRENRADSSARASGRTVLQRKVEWAWLLWSTNYVPWGALGLLMPAKCTNMPCLTFNLLTPTFDALFGLSFFCQFLFHSFVFF